MADLKTDPESKSNDLSPSTQAPDSSSPSFFATQDVELSVLDEPHQLGHGDTEHIATLPFRKCSISTKITDLRRCWFRDGRVGGGEGEGEGRREACVVVFELEFGDQIRGSGQRITEMGVWVLVEEVDEEGGEADEAEVSGRYSSGFALILFHLISSHLISLHLISH